MEKIKVVIENKQKTVKIPTGIRLLIRRCCHAVLEMENFEGSAEVDVSIVDNAQIQEINREHRKIHAVMLFNQPHIFIEAAEKRHGLLHSVNIDSLLKHP